MNSSKCKDSQPDWCSRENRSGRNRDIKRVRGRQSFNRFILRKMYRKEVNMENVFDEQGRESESLIST